MQNKWVSSRKRSNAATAWNRFGQGKSRSLRDDKQTAEARAFYLWVWPGATTAMGVFSDENTTASPSRETQ